MKTMPQKVIVLLFIVEVLVSCQQTLQTFDTTQEITAENVKLETVKDVTTEGSLKNADMEIIKDGTYLENHELKENCSNLLELENKNTSGKEKVYQTSNFIESDLVQIVLKDVSHSENNQPELKDNERNFTKYLIKLSTNPLNRKDEIYLTNKQKKTKGTEEVFTESLPTSTAVDQLTTEPSVHLKESRNLNLAEGELIEIVFKDVVKNLSKKQKEIQYTAEIPIESLEKVNDTTTSLISLEDSENSNLAEIGLIGIVLRDFTNLTNKQEKIKDNAKVLTESSIKVDASSTFEYQLTTKSSISLERSRNSNLTENGLIEIVSMNVTNFGNKQKEINTNAEASTESLAKVDATTTAEDQLTTKSLISLNASKNLILTAGQFSTESLAKEDAPTTGEYQLTTKSLISLNVSKNLNLVESELKDVTNLTNKQNKINVAAEASTESIAKVDVTAEDQLTRKSLVSKEASVNLSLPESELIQIVLRDVTETVVNSNGTSTSEDQLLAKPLISLEQYAVKQMNFILDHLLMETQEFVAKVLQASINSVFQKDHLKRYAEDINLILNPDEDSDYSDEVIKDTKIYTQEEIYEQIIQKLNFLKSKSTKSLQKNLPQEWLNDYRHKREELAIWLDKATDEMHTEFNCYITEDEDHIKYQYFNDTFEDISRATEIHHKLALLVDLVKIVKNKKQITFMDLYMQT